MKKIRYLACFLLLMGALFACDDKTTTTDTPTTDAGDSVTTTVQEPVVPEPIPVDLSRATISFKALAQKDNEQGVSQAKLYLYTSVTTDSLFLTDDVGGTRLEKDSYAAFGISDSALLGFQSYYAGGGTYYHATTQDNVLTVYKGVVDAPQLEVELPDPVDSYEGFKRFTFFEDKVIEEDL